MRKMQKYAAAVVTILALFGAVSARATFVIRPVAAQANSEFSSRGATNTWNGSGLSDPGLVTTGAPIPNPWPQQLAVNTQEWMSYFSPAVTINWDLGQDYALSGFHLWNYVESTYHRGIKYATVLISDDPTFQTGVTTISTWSAGLGFTEGVYGDRGQDYAFPSVDGRYVEFINLTTWGDTGYVGISEIRFEGNLIPEPSTGMLVGVGAGLLWWRRRSQRAAR